MVVLGAMLAALLATIVAIVENGTLAAVLIVLILAMTVVTYFYLKPKPKPISRKTSPQSPPKEVIQEFHELQREMVEEKENSSLSLNSSANDFVRPIADKKWLVKKWKKLAGSDGVTETFSCGDLGSILFNLRLENGQLLLWMQPDLSGSGEFIDFELISVVQPIDCLRARRLMLTRRDQKISWLDTRVRVATDTLSSHKNIELQFSFVLRPDSIRSAYVIPEQGDQWTVTWSLHDVAGRDWLPGEKVYSPVLRQKNDICWILQISPNGREKQLENDIGIFLALLSKPEAMPAVSAHFKVQVSIGDNPSKEFASSHRFDSPHGFGVTNDMGKLTDVQSDDSLVITWTVKCTTDDAENR